MKIFTFHAAVSEFQENSAVQTEGFTRQTTEDVEEDLQNKLKKIHRTSWRRFTEQVEEDCRTSWRRFTEQVEKDFRTSWRRFQNKLKKQKKIFQNKLKREENFQNKLREDFLNKWKKFCANTCATCTQQKIFLNSFRRFLDSETAETLATMESI